MIQKKSVKQRPVVLAPVSALTIIAVAFAIFVLYVEPILLQFASLEAWPVTAQAMRWVAPLLSGGTAWCAAELGLGRRDGAWVKYFTNTLAVVVLLALAVVSASLLFWAGWLLPSQLMLDRISG